MAEAVLTVVLENISSLIQNQVGSVLGVEKEMEKMCSIFSTISAVLEDAEERQSTNRSIKNWLQKLEYVSAELEDVLDDCEAEVFRLEEGLAQDHSRIRKVQSSLSCLSPKHLYFRHNIAKKMKQIGDRLDQIGKERVNFHLREVDVVERRNQVRESRQTGSVITQPHVYGREEDKERVVGFLVNDAINCNDNGTSVYCIVGLGGMGKTTLAQLVFGDVRVNEHFELKIWVCVSEDFDVRRLIKAIIESGTGHVCEAMEMDPLQKRLRDMLQGKRFLIVLDDVWNEKHDEWDKLKYVLECGSKGASVVVTTRLKNVASIMGTTPMHHYFLTGLSDDDCWLLFKQRAFGNHREERPNLVEIGKEIVKKCKGVPLVAKALGGLMCFKSDENEWLSVMHSELWNLPEDKTSILPALKLSYLHLSVEQRRCFSYCAIFPKDHRIEKRKLIHLWMANGLISSKPEVELEVEDVGNEMINDLCLRSFFQDMEEDSDGSISHFKMHDLVHDLAQSIMGDKCCNVEVDNRTIVLQKRVCHLTLSGWGLFPNIASTESLRTFLSLSYYSFPRDIKWNFRSLRAFEFDRNFETNLVISRISMSSLVNNSKHLRYLNLSRSDIEVFPDSICSLHHLLTLDISHCFKLRKLPKQMIHLKDLRHLYIEGCDRLSHLPPNIGKLSCLKTLTDYIVDKRKGYQLDELKNLKIRGTLDIRCLENVKSAVEAGFANLSEKTNLKNLSLSWNNNEDISVENAKEVLEALAPPTSLKLLEIHKYKGAHFPSWFRDDILGSVVCINLHNCPNCRELPPFGILTSLRRLKICNMDLVEYIDNRGDLRSSFGCLESLEIWSLPNLEGFSRHDQVGNEMFPSLSSLYVRECPKLRLPKLGSVKSLRVYGVSQQLLESISNLCGLTELHMEQCHLTSLPQNMLHNLTTLQKLTIWRFKKIQELPSDFLNGLIVLQTLEIRGCLELKCLPEGMFGHCSLRRIDIKNCPTIEEGFPSGPNKLISLQHLSIGGLIVLPEGLQHLCSLESLQIFDILELASLPDWLGNLTTLKDLRISTCRDLECIPMSMQRLTNLKKLSIWSCPKLGQRCEKEVGEDWHKISHIPHVDMMGCGKK
ncbi:hypothetical protein CsatB_027957 [Cannabis sativa]